MVLGWSRHMYAEFVFDQTITTWLQCHQRAFTFFGGVPERVVLDNLKTAIIQAYARTRTWRCSVPTANAPSTTAS